jgi:hypothetical protein
MPAPPCIPSTLFVQGRVSIPLRQVMERGRVRDTWPLQDVKQGSLTMELSWMGTLNL